MTKKLTTIGTESKGKKKRKLQIDTCNLSFEVNTIQNSVNLYKQTLQIGCFEFQILTHLKHARQELCDKKSTCLFFVMSVLIFAISHLDCSTHSVHAAAAAAATAYWVKWGSVRVPQCQPHHSNHLRMNRCEWQTNLWIAFFPRSLRYVCVSISIDLCVRVSGWVLRSSCHCYLLYSHMRTFVC